MGESEHYSTAVLGEGQDPEYLQYKVIILGDGAVGKTSLATRFTEDQFSKSYKQTVGLDFFIKRLVLKNDINTCLQIWDIGGQSIGSKMIGNYIFGAHAVVLVYDITNIQTFQNLDDWFSLVQRTFQGQPMPKCVLVGNKMDLTHLRSVKTDKHNEFAMCHSMKSYFVSAKTGDQVASTFYRIAADLAGVELQRPEVEVAQRAVKAELINHPRNDNTLPEVTADTIARRRGSRRCIVM
ncbi:unnamed protein product [Vitrella brassicaformis CCMP3155]|uniref:Ras-related protein Rab-28 n=1 Tax=Vitrella brassicaformis (strain CCMP3155) TaxID=1169540 RepID=A0A0G4EFY2_VITBC|nr:unnamed protein product [Vitrella brassicaformis CCMP3155]|eukprot:CEL94612.1 unnamed protein product [Vitrella brassicaformis CCMP3155]